jgi:predicted dehydrogenase
VSSLTRRTFVQIAGAGIAAARGALAQNSATAEGNSIVRHAIIGTGGQGSSHLRGFSSFDDCQVVAICDLDPERRTRAVEAASTKSEARGFDDYREVLDDPSIHSVSVATPDHWHTPVALAALKAGKHVYVEKPCCHNVHEGVVLAKAAEQTGLCVQHGTQSRSGAGIRDAMAFLHEGQLGKVRLAKAINHQLRGPIGRAPESEPPEGVNYDVWLGPAPVHAFTSNRWHYNWHWFWDYGTGDIGNDGIHQIDIARWGLNVGLPNVVSAPGGQLFYDDDHETPDTQIATYEYDDCYLVFEMRLWTDYKMDGHDNGVIFYGDKGTLEVGRQGCFVTFIGEEPKQLGGSHDFTANLRNFLDCVKTNNPAGLNAPISEGAVSSMLSHLGNIATRVNRRLQFDADRMECVGDEEATRLLARTYRKGYELPVVG